MGPVQATMPEDEKPAAKTEDEKPAAKNATPPSTLPERHGASTDERDLTKGERRRGGQDVR